MNKKEDRYWLDSAVDSFTALIWETTLYPLIKKYESNAPTLMFRSDRATLTVDCLWDDGLYQIGIKMDDPQIIVFLEYLTERPHEEPFTTYKNISEATSLIEEVVEEWQNGNFFELPFE